MITLNWINDNEGVTCAAVPMVEAGVHGVYMISIIPRPAYCDRGAYHVIVDWTAGFGLDSQEGFPRYYFELETAKREMELWVNKRASCLEAVNKPHESPCE